ncbi:MAG: carboxypeptidase regulatory-like domain-containing protein [Gemmatimonadaceae bacterium]
MAPLAIYVAPSPAVVPPVSARCAFVATVADGATNAPVEGADVTVSDLARAGRTNWIGEATLGDLPAGRHHVEVRRLGYAPAAIDVVFDRDTVGVFFVLAPATAAMDTLKVVGKVNRNPMLDEFEARRRMGIGHFIGDSVLQADSTKPVATIIAGHLPGFRSVRDGRTVSRFPCVGSPDIYINGARTQFSARGGDVTDLRLYDGRDIAGVEYYDAASAPVQFRRLSLSSCGVLLIWTR